MCPWTPEPLERLVNPYIRGWINYYSHFYKSAMHDSLRRIDFHLRKWARRKFKRFQQKPKSAREWLAEKGWDPAYGARPLKRVIQKAVQDPLAEMILAGTIKDGEKVAISGDKLGLTFNGKLAQAA